MPRPIRVLIVDDSALMRHRLSVIVGAADGFEVAGVATNGTHCLAQLAALQPDVITLDVEMPDMDGLSTLEQIMRQRPTPVIMVSSLTESGAQITLDALALGAVDYLAKPSAVSSDPTQPFGVELLHKLAVAAQVRIPQLTRHAVTRPAPRLVSPPTSTPAPQPRLVVPPTATARPLAPSPTARPFAPRRRGETLVLIGSSTGGPQSLDRLFSALPDQLPAALLVVQHMPPLFTRSLAARLDRRTTMEVREAQEGDQPAPGLALVAPGDWHMTLGQDYRLHLDQGPTIHGVRPSVDRTLLSLARHWTGRCLAVILTGMGVDGTDGARALRARHGEVYAQDEESCIVYGMPRSVVEAGLASAVLPLDKMAAAIERWTHAERSLGASAV